MTFPPVTPAEWRAQVDKDLAGVPFDKALVHTTAEGIAVQPLYTEAPALALPPPRVGPFGVCMAHDTDDPAAMLDDLDGGADALWLRGNALPPARSTHLVLDRAHLSSLPATQSFALTTDPMSARARGTIASLPDALAALGRDALLVAERHPRSSSALVSTLAWHSAGADAADELALALSSGVAYLGALLDAGLDAPAAARQIAVQVAVGRDTFGELCKLRALRWCWAKLLAAAGAPAVTPRLHAVCSSRTVTARDPWVNLLRVSTQVFAAVLGGADLVTPTPYDAALATHSALGRRAARNTCLVLREEAQLGRVVDPAAGSYYLESLTDALAREAWRRFQDIEKTGGIARCIEDGSLRARLDAAWSKRRAAVAKRKEPITGVSEFANLDEPAPSIASAHGGAWPAHRDAEDFERLRDAADGLHATVTLVTLGPASEHRARAGFAASFFATGGLRVVEGGPVGRVACLCGSDDRYAAEAASAARHLKADGCARVLLAGRPGALEGALREAGVDDFIYMGTDVIATMTKVLEALS